MNLQTGTILNWPLAGDWLDNAKFLRAMTTTWKSWKFHTSTAKDWTAADLAYQDWLNEGKAKKQSEYELWLESKDNG
jgi:hypothetical protein